MKNIVAVILSLFFLSCKYNDDNKIIQKENREIHVEKNNNTSKNLKIDCPQIIFSLIKGSNLKNPFKDNLKIEIMDNNGVNMKLRLFEANDKLENTIGWLLFDAENMRLLDITKNEQNPEKLEFDKILWNKTIACFFNNDTTFCFDLNDEKEKNEDCKTTIIDMDNIEECLFKNTTIRDVYSKLINEHGVNDSEFLNKTTPKSNESIIINQKGIINIDYEVVSSDEIKISMNYEGGITRIKIQKINNNVKQTVTYSAD